MEAKAYVEHREDGYWVTGTRVSLDEGLRSMVDWWTRDRRPGVVAAHA